MTETTWGQLTDENAGQSVSFTFPWDEAPTAGVFVARMGEWGQADDGVALVRHVIDYGGEIGEQETQLRADLPVTKTDESTPM